MNGAGPVFVVGVNGSGTTMLADALGRHPALYMLPQESKVLPYFARRFDDAGLAEPAARARLARELGAARAFFRINGSRVVDLGPAEALPPSLAGIVDRLYGQFAARAGKPRWGDKSPMNLQHLALLGRRFPDGRFVHIVRDARDAAQSFHRRWHQDPRRTVYRWKMAVRAGRAQGQALGPDRYLEVSYERLTADPEACLREVAAFVGLPFDAAMLESSMRWMDEQARAGSAGRIVPNSGRWQAYFSAAQVRALEAIAGAALAEQGYAVADAQGDADPSPLRLRWWQLKDRLHFSLDHFRQYGWAGLGGFVRRVRDAMRQARVNRF
jgi:hypothetical protein